MSITLKIIHVPGVSHTDITTVIYAFCIVRIYVFMYQNININKPDYMSMPVFFCVINAKKIHKYMKFINSDFVILTVI